ncbi:MAG: lipocalin family protein [Bacteroidota bacterium]
MKKIIGIVLIIVAISFAGCSKSVKDKLVGTWKLESIEGRDIKNLPQSTLEFKEDGVATEKMEDLSRDYQWKLSDDETELIIIDKGKDKKMKIESLEGNTLVIKGDNGKVTLKKQ